MNFRKVNTIILAITLLIIMMAPIAYAEGGQTSGKIDSILMQKEDDVVVISINEYAKMCMLRSGPLYEFLLNTNGQLQVFGVVSGEKYITLNSYAKACMLNPGNLPAALEFAEAIPDNVVDTFKEVIVDEDGNITLVPIGGEQEPSIEATFIQRGLANFGFVISEVNNLPDAAKFRVGYYVNNNGIPQMEWTEIVNINEEAGSIVYNPNSEPPYNMVNVEIYNESEELIWTFENIILRMPEENSTLQMLITPNLVIYN